ncbi:MAG: hypothetical protein H6936_06935 [Burkholderiales bacterium]|nr:hypothetical protein [Nitrosomonas sp.]MCP5274576.1 hypothetical protein [Burkholderiales bacterium]
MIEHIDPLSNREQFNFIEAVRSEFSYLSDYGYSCVKVEPTIVRYKSDTAFLNIYHGRISFEIAAEFGQLKWYGNSQSYSVSELIRLSDPEAAKKYKNYAAHSPDGVKAGVKRLSVLLKKYADNFLNGTPCIFAKLSEQGKELIEEFAAEVLLRQVRPEAEEAFRNKDFVKAARLYASIESELSAAERKKLAYSRKHS